MRHLEASGLMDDKAFISAQQKVSQFAGDYYLSAHRPSCVTPRCIQKEFCEWPGGLNRVIHVNSESVQQYNDNLAQPTRPNEMPSTELFGTAPYKLTGIGVLRYTETSNNLVRNMGSQSSKCVPRDQKSWARWECIDLPPVPLEQCPRGGVSSRTQPIYYTGTQTDWNKMRC